MQVEVTPDQCLSGGAIMSSAVTSHANLWLQRDDKVVLSSWRVRLLEAIDATGSISSAAERMQVQYRCAWDKLDEMESGLGILLVERHAGGAGGGGARLTQAGREYVDRFSRFSDAIQALVSQEFDRNFAGVLPEG
jgi:molybdate transport system regulatory protein